jgi:hypothetical protein
MHGVSLMIFIFVSAQGRRESVPFDNLDVPLAGHILRYASYFCNQSREKVTELDYTAQVRDAAAIQFVNHHSKVPLRGIQGA